MSQVKELLQQNELWNDLIATFHSGTVPGAVGIETRPIWQEEIMRIFASHILLYLYHHIILPNRYII